MELMNFHYDFQYQSNSFKPEHEVMNNKEWSADYISFEINMIFN